jgi:Na+/H+ antiporter NhaD/arsenite permease-like protein
MTIVEVMKAHNGFEVITSRIKTQQLSALIWMVGFVSFFLSAVQGNLTTTIVMVSLMKRLLFRREDRLFFAIIKSVFLPSLVTSRLLSGRPVVAPPPRSEALDLGSSDFERKLLFVLGMAILVLMSVFKTLTSLPPYMGMYGLEQYPLDSFLWEFIAYCDGTGGSILITCSAAGVAAMGMEKIDFVWYLKSVSALAMAGYISGAIVFMAQHQWLQSRA